MTTYRLRCDVIFHLYIFDGWSPINPFDESGGLGLGGSVRGCLAVAVIIYINKIYIDDILGMLNVMIKVNGWMKCDELF